MAEPCHLEDRLACRLEGYAKGRQRLGRESAALVLRPSTESCQVVTAPDTYEDAMSGLVLGEA